MQSPDVQRITHILDYCQRIENTVSRYGRDAAVFESDMDYQQSIAFSILQLANCVEPFRWSIVQPRSIKFLGVPSKECEILLSVIMAR